MNTHKYYCAAITGYDISIRVYIAFLFRQQYVQRGDTLYFFNEKRVCVKFHSYTTDIIQSTICVHARSFLYLQILA